MTDSVRWGILGASDFARGAMGPAIHGARGAELVAIASSSAEKAAGFAAFAPGIAHLPSYEALLASDAVEAVYIPLPNHLHVEWAERALRAGKHVLVEKPLAQRAEEIDRLIGLRDETGLFAAEGFMVVHHPQWTKAREIVAGGMLGELRQITAAFSFNNPDPANIRNRADAAGGAMGDIGVYVVGGLRFATGAEPDRILHAEVRREGGIDATVHFAAAFPGFRADAYVSMRMAMRQEMVFHGAEGTLRLTAPFNAGSYGEAQLHMEIGQEVTTWRWPGVNQYVLQVEAACKAIREGASYVCPLEFSRGSQAMIDAVFAAAEGK
ncbi:Gfo/Idh/MocA family protein [Wenxinia saemankumensis]|uniref:Predicted dehydrogenase n=1 Tax=Wenxinia saemankumensis TaxID=1447782 RepID=A0A1M6AKP8_9RHOB|nr:Gfo/Idh/MocA family oxidoreductase [Wenxinia saemankumensis]SHI37089.1 Predicted dehydrogenase [Wenxinia saemankumensis]